MPELECAYGEPDVEDADSDGHDEVRKAVVEEIAGYKVG